MQKSPSIATGMGLSVLPVSICSESESLEHPQVTVERDLGALLFCQEAAAPGGMLDSWYRGFLDDRQVFALLSELNSGVRRVVARARFGGVG